MLIALTAIPLILPAISPLADLPGHLARYKIELDLDSSPYLRQWYGFEWKLVGNLGVDLLIIPMAKLFGLEWGLKLIVLAIPSLTVAGMLYLAREIHGEVPPTALFAVPLAYGYPFQFGFLNFVLCMALVLWAMAFWLHLGRLNRIRLRAALFVPISLCLFIAHSAGWGIFGLAVFALETRTLRDAGENWPRSTIRAAIRCLPNALPLLLLAGWWSGGSGGSGGETGGYFHWFQKIYHFLSIFRTSNVPFDMLCVLIPCALVYAGIRRHGLRIEPRLGTAALLLFCAFLLMPAMIMGSAFADMRMVPYVVIIAVLALAPVGADSKSLRIFAALGLAFIAVRLGVQTWFYVQLDQSYRRQLAALDHIPQGARIFGMVNLPCPARWDTQRLDHLTELAIVRREAFTNGQWRMPGSPLLTIHYPAAGNFAASPSHMLEPAGCRRPDGHSLEYTLRHLPYAAFDYVWLVDLPRERWPRADNLQPVWHGETGILYRIKQPRS